MPLCNMTVRVTVSWTTWKSVGMVELLAVGAGGGGEVAVRRGRERKRAGIGAGDRVSGGARGTGLKAGKTVGGVRGAVERGVAVDDGWFASCVAAVAVSVLLRL